MKDLDIIGLPLEYAISKIDEDLSIKIVETKGTNSRLNENLKDLRVVKFDIKEKFINIVVCAF